MNRIEIIATFTALRELYEVGAHEGIKRVIDRVLEEAESKKESAPAPDYDLESALEEAGSDISNELKLHDGAINSQAEAAPRERLFRIGSDEKVIELKKVTIEITDFSAEGFDGDLSSIYTAKVIADEADILLTGISIFLREDETLAMKIAVGETYITDLTYWEAVPYFTIMKIY